MQNILKVVAITLAGALTACEKHLEHNQDTPAINHPTDEKGTPKRSPGPEVPPPQAPATGSEGTVGTGVR